MPKKTLYIPGQNEPFELSRSKVDLFLQCPKCFYIDRSEKHRIKRPSGPMSYIPTAIDLLLKEEFDELRAKGEPHPIFKEYNLNFVPYNGLSPETLKKYYPNYAHKIYKTGSPRADLWGKTFSDYWNVPSTLPKKPFLLVLLDYIIIVHLYLLIFVFFFVLQYLF